MECDGNIYVSHCKSHDLDFNRRMLLLSHSYSVMQCICTISRKVANLLLDTLPFSACNIWET